MKRAWLVLLMAACGPATGGPAMPVDTFVAFAADFSGYPRWESYALKSTQVQGEVHSTGERHVYLSRRPPAGSTAFPVGTLIVKALPGAGRVFAMVKRGGAYNTQGYDGGIGAPGWEWFELQHVNLDEVVLVWRGYGPPAGEGYGGDPNGCNGCHVAARENDYVQSPGLQLRGW